MKTQTKQRITSVAVHAAAQKPTVFAVALLVVGAVSYFGASLQQDSKAITPPPTALYISPESGSFTTGATFSAAVRVTSGTEPVNTVQASLNYDPAQLEFVSLTDGTAFPTVAATSTTPGLIRVARATQAAPVTGDNAVVTVTFRMLASSATTPVNVGFDAASSYVVRSTDNTNILASSSGARYAVRLPAPTVTAATPASGPAAGGTVVAITGTNFVSGAKVSFGTAPAAAVTFVSGTSLQVTAPGSTTGGARNIVITNPDGQTATLVNGFTYVAPPTLSTVSPTSGVVTGGTKLTLSGTNFVSGVTVTVGGAAATSVAVVSGTSITALAPAHALGLVDIVVKNPDGQSVTKAGAFTYVNPAPTISAITPNAGFVVGGQQITITGTNISSGATVTIGGIPATEIAYVPSSCVPGTVCISGISIMAKSPAHAAGIVNVVVKNTDGQTATLTGGYTYKVSGDSNGDARINALDLSAVISHDGQNYPPSDFNGDGTVGAADMAILLAAWTW
ncbi:MAG TPA: IPT/TIG domain-containing protein [Candidatus Limnocylindrales bacterium]|nr:IPT/TIG domain-containing protein [Candidatus Limnocylindrales bacterium]